MFNLISSYMSGGNRSYKDKAELWKTGAHIQYEAASIDPKRFLQASSQYHYFMPSNGGQGRISYNNSFFCGHFSVFFFFQDKSL